MIQHVLVVIEAKNLYANQETARQRMADVDLTNLVEGIGSIVGDSTVIAGDRVVRTVELSPEMQFLAEVQTEEGRRATIAQRLGDAVAANAIAQVTVTVDFNPGPA